MKMKEEPIQVEIHTPYIKLDQLLKFEQIIGTGGQVKFLLDDEKLWLMVNFAMKNVRKFILMIL